MMPLGLHIPSAACVVHEYNDKQIARQRYHHLRRSPPERHAALPFSASSPRRRGPFAAEICDARFCDAHDVAVVNESCCRESGLGMAHLDSIRTFEDTTKVLRTPLTPLRGSSSRW